MTNSEPPATPGPSADRRSTTNPTSSPAAATPAAAGRREWADLAAQIAGPDPVVETYLQKVGRHNMARLQASEILHDTTPAADDPTRPSTSQAGDADCPLPPDLPADPTHPLNTDADLMSDQEYQAALAAWRATEEYQTPLRQYQAWQQSRTNS